MSNIYSQNNPAWKDLPLGFDSSDPNNPNYGTIGMYGCYVTAIANVCNWAGNNLNPSQINDLGRQNNWFIRSDLVSRDDIPSLLCSNLQFVGRTNWTGPTDMSFFDDASSPEVNYIIEIDASKAPGIQTHFTMVWAKLGESDLEIDDSWDGIRRPLSHYGNPSAIIQSAMKFVKVTPPAPVPTPIVVATPEPAPAPAPVIPPLPYVPPAAPVKGTPAEKYELLTTVMWFSNANDAVFHKDAKGTLEEGSYFIVAKNDKSYNLSSNNMKDSGQWINTDDNIAPKPVVPEVKPAATADIPSLFTPFTDGKSRRYVAQQDMYLYDLAATDARGINIKKDEVVPIFGSVTKGGMIYLIPRLNEDTVPNQVAPKEHYYGIPTSSIYTGLPGMKSQQYIDALKQAESDNRVYRKSVHHETAEDKLYYAEQTIARAVGSGVRFLDGIIPISKVIAYLKGQKDKK